MTLKILQKERKTFPDQGPREFSKSQHIDTAPMLGNPREVFSANSGLPVEAGVHRR